jgi:hypothetical protein
MAAEEFRHVLHYLIRKTESLPDADTGVLSG